MLALFSFGDLFLRLLIAFAKSKKCKSWELFLFRYSNSFYFPLPSEAAQAALSVILSRDLTSWTLSKTEVQGSR